jgi:viologen exporter family transport system permease protein
VSFLRDLYGAFIRIALAVEMQYRASNVIWLLGMVVEPLIYLVVWSAAANAQGGRLAGYGPHEFAAYYLVLAAVNQITSGWHMWEFQFRIQQGQFAFLLLRPVHPIHNDLAENLAHKLAMQVALLPALGLLALAFRPRADLHLWSTALFPLALALAFAVRFVFEWTLALAAFWTTRIMAVNQTYFAVLFFLSGRVAPLALLPGWLRALADALPFRFMVGFPVELVLGRVPQADALAGLALQVGWVGLGSLLLWWLWPRAVARFSSVGN